MRGSIACQIRGVGLLCQGARGRVLGTVVVAMWVWFTVGTAIAAALPTLSVPKNGVACQKALLGASRTFLATKLKNLDGCATAALKCIQLKGSAPKCLAKARTKCDPDALTKIAAAEDKLVAKVLGACGEDKISLADLRDATALGYDTRQAECSDILSGACANPVDPECTTADDPFKIAACIAFAHGRAAEALFGIAQARAREVIGIAQVDESVFPDLPDHGGDGAATTGPGKEAKLVTTCIGAIAKAALKLTATGDKALGTCLTAIVACTSKAPADQTDCLGKAGDTCRATAAKIAAQRGTLAAKIDKKCAESTLPFATLRSASAANLDALACECQSVGVEAVDDLGSLQQCLARQHECRLASLVPLVAPRADDLLALVNLGIRDLACPPLAPPAPVRLSGRPFFFGGGITRFLRGVIRDFNRVPGVLVKTGRPPTSLTGAPHTIKNILHPLGRRPIARGGLSLLRVRFGDLHKTPNAARRAEPAATAVQQPAMVVAVRRADGTFEDGYFQVLLSTEEGEDDIEVAFPIELPSCAFEIAFATIATDGEIGEYVGVEVVPDLTAPIATTPTPTATPTASSTSTAPTTPPTDVLTPTPTFTTPFGATPTETPPTSPGDSPTPTITNTP